MDLFVARLDGSPLQQLTFGETSFVGPDVDSDWRMYVTQLRREDNVWKIPIDGSPVENVRRAVQVTSQTGQVQTPSLSPDGREMVYLSDFGGHSNLWVMTLDGSAEARQITFERDPNVAVGVPIWSPDGRYITFFSRRRDTSVGDQWVVSPDGSNLRRLVPEGGWAAWSSDGKWLYVSLQRYENHPYTIAKVSVDHGETVQVRTDESFIGSASVSDRDTLYFARMRSRAPGNQDVEIHRASPESGRSQMLARIPARLWPIFYLVQPVISPDGKWLALMLADGPTTNLYLMPTNGGPLRRVTDFGNTATEIARRVSWSPDSKHIYAAVTRLDADVVALTNLLPHN
jgi:Tol biopolymer transport system component